MTSAEALRLLQIHSGRDAESDPAKWENGFLVPLRYHPDDVNEGNFLEVMECIRALAQEIATSPAVDRQLMAALWGLMHYPHWWAFNPNQLEGYIRAKSHTLDGKAPGAMLAALGEHVFTSESCPNMPTQKPWAWHPCTMWGGDFFCPFRA